MSHSLRASRSPLSVFSSRLRTIKKKGAGEGVNVQLTWILHDEMAGGVFAASHFVVVAARGKGQNEASRLPFVRDLRREDPSIATQRSGRERSVSKFVVRRILPNKSSLVRWKDVI